MKTWRKQWVPVIRALGAGAAIITVMLLAASRVWSTPPVLKIVNTGTNTVALSITNGSPSGVYEIYWQEFLDSTNGYLTNGNWTLIESGATGQTNFGPYDISELWTGFFRALNTIDFDADGSPDCDDARPFDPSVGILNVTIESPASGAVVY
jgi:hypothetical protein